MNDKDDQTVILDALAEIAENLLPDCLVDTVQVVKCLVQKFNLPDQALLTMAEDGQKGKGLETGVAEERATGVARASDFRLGVAKSSEMSPEFFCKFF